MLTYVNQSCFDMWTTQAQGGHPHYGMLANDNMWTFFPMQQLFPPPAVPLIVAWMVSPGFHFVEKVPE